MALTDCLMSYERNNVEVCMDGELCWRLSADDGTS